MDDQEVITAQIVLKTVVLSLKQEGLITKDQANDYLNSHIVIKTKKNIFERVYSKLTTRENKYYYWDVFKRIDSYSELSEETDETNPDSLAELQFKLIQAEKLENYEEARKLKIRINNLKTK